VERSKASSEAQGQGVNACLECIHATRKTVWRSYDEDCIGCQIRLLAYMGHEARELQLDTLERCKGRAARSEVVKLLRLEMARIKALRDGRQCA
jgi:hypothetical protein